MSYCKRTEVGGSNLIAMEDVKKDLEHVLLLGTGIKVVPQTTVNMYAMYTFQIQLHKQECYSFLNKNDGFHLPGLHYFLS